jgi:hypothetical protein
MATKFFLTAIFTATFKMLFRLQGGIELGGDICKVVIPTGRGL